jgi:photosystem II stability/assembly factor-like uncharacterized protein
VPVSSDLVAVCFGSGSAGWAVGHDGVVLRTTDAGITWTRQLDGHRAGEVLVEFYSRADSTLDPERSAAMTAEAERFAAQGAENPFLDVWCEDEQSAFVVGAFGLILRTSDGGATWEPWLHRMDNPGGLHLYAVRGVGDERYIVGEQGLALRLDRDAGQFRALELPYRGTLFGLIGNANAVVAFGLRGTVLRSTDGGTTWTTVETGLQVGLTGGALAPDGRMVIVSQAGHVLVSADDGATFKPAPVERPAPAAAVVAAGTGALVVAGPRGVRAIPLPPAP